MPDLLFEIHAGISGDMILGALFDLGLDFNSWNRQIKKLNLPQVSVKIRKISKKGIKATRVTIAAPKQAQPRNLAAIRKIIKQSHFPTNVENRTLKIFSNLAKAEAKIHGCGIQSIHFHELGGIDAIIDIAGACLGFEMLDIKNFYSTPFTFGYGEIACSHGPLPVPSPATLELSRNFPARRTRIQGELCTPTGTAIVATLANPNPFISDYITKKIGYGAGAREIESLPNVLRLSLIKILNRNNRPEPGEEIFQIECNFDDLSPEILGYLTQQLFRAGCADVWQEPIFMKKNRAGIKLCALAAEKILKKTLWIIARETSTGGIRYFPVKRIVSEKTSKFIKTKYGDIQVKRIQFNEDMGNILRWAPEYESCKKISQSHKLPLQQVFLEALSILTERKP